MSRMFDDLLTECNAALERRDESVSGEEFREAVKVIIRLATMVEEMGDALELSSAHIAKLDEEAERMVVLQEAVAFGGPVKLQAFTKESVDKISGEITALLQKVAGSKPL